MNELLLHPSFEELGFLLIDLIVSSQACSDSNQPINRALRDPRFVKKAGDQSADGVMNGASNDPGSSIHD